MILRQYVIKGLACLGLILSLFLSLSAKKPPDTTNLEEKVRWLEENGVSIRTAAPDDEDFADLMPLVDKIGSARLVLLGEQSHGDGTTFLMKCRLVRFLHQVMGFDVLAWESGLYDCRRMESALHNDVPLDMAIAKGVFPLWGMSDQVRPVFTYARSTYGTPRPLEMAGYDCQFSSPMTVASFEKELTAFLERPVEKWISSEMFSGLKKAVAFQQLAKMAPEKRRENQQVIKEVGDLIAVSKPVLQKAHSQREIAFWERVLKNYQVFYTLLENMSKGKDRKSSDNNPRDEAMAENLIWLANDLYPDRKIIVWAASFHNIRNIQKINLGDSRLDYAKVVTMGQRIYEKLAENIYSIAFTAYQGESGNVNRKETYDIGRSSEGSLEDLIHRTGKEFLFVDFTQPRLNPTHWLCRPITARPLGYTPMKTVWPEHFDAIIFTENMIPSTRIKNTDLKKEE